MYKRQAQVFEACGCLKPLSIHFDLCVDATGVVCHQLGLLSTDLHAPLSRRSTKFASSSSSPAKPSMSSAKWRLVMYITHATLLIKTGITFQEVGETEPMPNATQLPPE